MPYLSGISWGKAFVVSFVGINKRSNLIDIRGRGLLMRMFAIVKISFFAFPHAGFSSLVFFNSRNVVEGVATEKIEK
jgi:hypothetical protein